MRRAIPAILVLAVIGVAVALWFHRRPAATPRAAAPEIGTSTYGQARADAQRLSVRGWEGRMDFTRYRFGEAWFDRVRPWPRNVGRRADRHVVSLSDAWYKGAGDWDDQRRRDFANDPRNLLAVDGKANFDKAFRDVASWLPPNAGFRCEFVERVVAVKSAYGLSVSAKEKRAIVDVLERC